MSNIVSPMVTAGGQARRLNPDDEIEELNKADSKLSQQVRAVAVPQKVTKAISYRDFAALTIEDTLAVEFDAALPANARIVGHEVILATPFNDAAGNPDVAIEVGETGVDVDKFITSHNVGHDGASGPGASGVKGYPMCDNGLVKPAVLFTTNNGAHLVGLDAGAVTVNLFYVVVP